MKYKLYNISLFNTNPYSTPCWHYIFRYNFVQNERYKEHHLILFCVGFIWLEYFK